MTMIAGTLGAALPTAFVLVVLGLAALSDLRRYLIPNRYPALLILGFLLRTAFVAVTGQEVGIAAPFAIAAVLFAGGYILWRLGLLGGGDVKLNAALGLWLTPATVLPYLQIMALAGGLLALLVLLLDRVPRLRQSAGLAGTGMLSRNRGVPYGIAIAVGAAAVLA